MSENAPSITVLDRLVEHLRSRDVVHDGQERPVAILWTDPRQEWNGLAATLRERLGEFLTLGSYDPHARTGPAIWIRCLVDRTLNDPKLPTDRLPIVYLPGVGRQDLRAGDDSRDDIRPLVELMFQGAMFLQPNGTDWTVFAFLTSPRGLGLNVARDESTVQALRGALVEVALTPVLQLSDKALHAEDFDRLLTADVIRDVLRWLGDPNGTKARLGGNGWAAFRNRCKDDLDFDPETTSDVVAGALLGDGQDGWELAWERFSEAPANYPGMVALLRRSRRKGTTFAFGEGNRWPDINDEDEQVLRSELTETTSLPRQGAREAILRLEAQHGRRRTWVWARLGLSPLALALEPLAKLASSTAIVIGGGTPDDAARAYVEQGWHADAASWEAIAAAPTGDEKLFADLTRNLLLPWLDDSARAFQAAAERHALPSAASQPTVTAADDCCLVFVDGLRYDLGCRLAERVEARGCRVTVGHRWAALPTVTPTAKPAATPVADAVSGQELGGDFTPRLTRTGKPANAENLREVMRSRGYQVLGDGMFDAPASHPARGWLETAAIDSLGHTLRIGLARQINDELNRLAERIVGLLDAGWKSLRVVTDHGWLLMPGGLPKVELPRHLTESRWSRCAVIAAGATPPDAMRAPWHWNPSRSFATAPGVACFRASEEYSHGGLSLQECLTPDLLVERSSGTVLVATIRSITWRGLRCLVEASVKGSGVSADLRLERPNGTSVAAAAKSIESDGAVSLVLGDDEHERASLVLVLVSEEGQILAQRPTRVGEDS
ncbi:MAG TPA: BREX-1 system phosphatase PglZ type B [Vicinamibacterales bacterium]|nr:BREX-1 system phosphatase PglZ type B [Vicinamibacterales bacterium]